VQADPGFIPGMLIAGAGMPAGSMAVDSESFVADDRASSDRMTS